MLVIFVMTLHLQNYPEDRALPKAGRGAPFAHHKRHMRHPLRRGKLILRPYHI